MPADATVAEELLHLSEVPCRAVVLEEAENLQHVLFKDDCRALQLALTGANAFQPGHLLAEAVVPPDRVEAHLAALSCLNDLCVSGHLRQRHFPPEPRGRRLAFVLQALDGWLAGAAHRDIAVALFGRARVQADWGDPGDHLRDRVRRAVRRGQTLMDGGYRQFLR